MDNGGILWLFRYPPPVLWFINGVDGRLFGIIGDTIMGGKYYHKLGLSACGNWLYSFNDNCTGNGPCDWDEGWCYSASRVLFQYVGRVRIDSNRVYFILDTACTWFNCFILEVGKEYLLYDFNIIPGGKFHSDLSDDTGFTIVTIDSVTLSDGKKVSRYTDSLGNYWLWGIGQVGGTFGEYSLWSLYEQPHWFGPGDTYYGSTNYCYQNPSFSYQFDYVDTVILSLTPNSCFDGYKHLPPCWDTGSPPNNPSPNPSSGQGVTGPFLVYPNPAQNTIIVQFNDTSTVQTVAITNLPGQTMLSFNYYSEFIYYGFYFSAVQLDISNLPNGMYIVTVNGTIVSKFVKQE